MADVFISYAREDQAFAQDLAEALMDRGQEVWGDWKDIPFAANWQDEARTGIEASESVVFVITRDSVESANCLYELSYAESYGKRIITVRKDPLEAKDLPPPVAPINWIDFVDATDVEAGWERVAAVVDEDREWVRGHKRWLQEALEWDRSGRDSSFLASGKELAEARAWLAQAQDVEKQPPATGLHYQFILSGRRAARKRLRRLLGVAALALLVPLAIAAAVAQRREAQDQRRVAVSRLLASQARAEMDRRLDRGLLLSAAAYSVKPTPEARDSVLAGLRRSERVAGLLPPSGGSVLAVRFAPKRPGVLATGAADGRVRVWDLRTRRARAIGGHLSAVRRVSFNDDGTLFASLDRSGRALVQLVTGDAAARRPLHGTKVESLEFSPRVRLLALATEKGVVVLWDPRSDRVVQRRPVSAAPITALAFSADGTRLAAGGPLGAVVLRLRDGLLVEGSIPIAEGEAVLDLAFSASGDRLAIVSADGSVTLANLSGETAVTRELDPVSDRSVAVAVRRAGDLVVGNNDGTITIWDRAWRAQVATLDGHGADLTDLALDDGVTLASSSVDGAVVLWKLSQTLFRRPLRVTSRDVAPLRPLYDLAFTPDGRGVAASGLDRVLFALSTGPVQELSGPGGRIDLAMAHERARLAAAGQQGTALWTLAARPKREPSPPGRYDSPESAVALNKDGGMLAAGTSDGAIRLWALGRSAGPRRLAPPGGSPIAALAFSPTDNLLASGAESGAVTLWDTVRGTAEAVRKGGDSVGAVEFSPDGRLVAFAAGQTVVLWTVRSSSYYAFLIAHSDAVTDVDFLGPDGRVLASSDEGGRVALWDVRERRSIGEPFAGAAGPVAALDFRPDGEALAVGASSGDIVLWDTIMWDADRARTRICALVDRPLTKAERRDFIPAGTDADPCP